jgi:Exocyst complex component Sec10
MRKVLMTLWRTLRENGQFLLCDDGSWLTEFYRSINTLSFNAMDSFMSYIIACLQQAAVTANAVFPPASCVLLLFAERLGSEIVAEYVNGLLARAREVDAEVVNSNKSTKRRSGVAAAAPRPDEWTTIGAEQGQELYLQATAASFVVCWKAVDTLVESGDGTVERTEAESIVYAHWTFSFHFY